MPECPETGAQLPEVWVATPDDVHPSWCSVSECFVDHDGSEWHVQTLAAVATQDGPLRVGLLRIDKTDIAGLWVDLLTDDGSVASVNLENAKKLRDLLNERITLMEGRPS